MANEKSKAEQYRDERKARIAKVAKQNAKGIEKKTAAKKTASRIISIILCAAIAIGVVGSVLNYYGVWERAIVIGGVGEDNIKVSAAEYEYYYMQVYNQFVQNVNYSKQYGQDMGYDTSLAPDKQTTTYKDQQTGEEMAWDEYIREAVINQIKQIKTYYNAAVKEGIKLSAADEASVDKSVESYAEQGKKMGDGENGRAYSLNAFLRFYYGPMNESSLRKVIKQQMLAYSYTKTVVENLSKGYTQDKVDETYNKDKSKYDVIDVRIYTLSTTKLEAKEGEKEDALAKRQKEADEKIKKQADTFLAAAKDEQSFIAQAKALNTDDAEYDADASTGMKSVTKATAEQNFQQNEDVAKWLFDAKTPVGQAKLFKTEGDTTSYTILMITKGMHQEKTVSVRHILFMTQDQQTGEKLPEDKIAEAKKNAEDAVKTWQSGEKTEDSFAALAADLTEDTGSQQTGGLYDNFLPGQMVKPFNDWAFDANRKTGDVEIVETDYGYHVIYFVSKNGDYYDGAIRKELSQEDGNKKLDELINADANVIRFGVDNEGKGIKFAEGKVLKKIASLLQMQSQSNTAGY